MQTQISRFVHANVAASLAAGCASAKPRLERVTFAQESGSARATAQRVTAGGRVDQMDKEVQGGKLVYDAEAMVGGKHAESLIGVAGCVVLGTEVSSESSRLPEPAQSGSGKIFWFGLGPAGDERP